jgi:hypothetical protein
VAPHTDKKIITAWNGLALTAFAKGYAVLGNESYLSAACSAADFLLDKLAQRDGNEIIGLWHTYKDGFAKVPGFLDDYAALTDGLLSLFHVTFDVKWIEAATRVADLMFQKFWDRTANGFYYSEAEHRDLLTRVRDGQDGATPSGTSMAFTALVRLSNASGTTVYDSVIEKGLSALLPNVEKHPGAFSQLLTAIYEWSRPHTQWITIADKTTLTAARDRAKDRLALYQPQVTRWIVEEGQAARWAATYPVLSKKTLAEGKVRHFVCRDFVCSAPTDDEAVAAREAGLA